MSAVKKFPTTPDAATLDLWRVAETGDLKALAAVLARVRDINAQNEHGVTALMRAAQFGHVKMVRALLEYGADANIQRNDKFTALALAAFFGHTEIVRALMEHGADLQASTRHDTSPHMWATARTFNDVADQLEKPAVVEKPVEKSPPPRMQPVVTAGPVMQATAKSAVIHTLKDPPEIWDLVHEAPRGFNAGSVFFTRLKSMKGLALRLAVLVVLIGAGVVGVMVFRRMQARNEGAAAVITRQPPPVATMTLQTNTPAQNTTQPAAVDTSTSFTPLPPLPPAETAASAGEQPPGYRRPGSRSRFVSRRGEPNVTPEVASSETAQPVATAPAKANPEPRSDVQPKAKESSALGPQMIAPANSATPKGKVIQWP